MSRLVDPHGGTLVDRFVPAEEVENLRHRAENLPQITLDAREQADLELIATGAASPLIGFLGLADYRSVLERLRLADGTVWPLPFTLAVDDRTRDLLRSASEAALGDASGRVWGVIRIQEVYTRDPLAESRAVYGTEDASHPGVAYLLARPRTLIGGPVRVLPLPELPFARYRLTPRALRAEIAARGWRARGRLPDAQPHPPRARAPHQGRARSHGRPRPPSPGRRDQGRRRARVRALPGLRGPGGGLLPEGPHDPGRLPRRHALCGTARGALPRPGAQELRHHPPARRARSRGSGQVLRAVRRARDVRPLHARPRSA